MRSRVTVSLIFLLVASGSVLLTQQRLVNPILGSIEESETKIARSLVEEIPQGKSTRSQNGNSAIESLIKTGTTKDAKVIVASQSDYVAPAASAARRDYCPEDPSVMSCCFPWSYNTDNWWLHRPEWVVSSENDTSLCFRRIQNETLVSFIQELHQVQFNSTANCSLLRSRWLGNSGYAHAIVYILKGWITHYQDRVPVGWGLRWTGSNWRFAQGVCENNDMTCYFLPMTNCNVQRGGPNGTMLTDAGQKRYIIKPHYENWFKNERQVMRQYFTRPQHWMRKHVYDYSRAQMPEIQTPCVVMHVRRTDVAMEKSGRTYVPLQRYLDGANITEGSNILLLTDDRSAIEEAHTYHPSYNWMYLNRTRHFGTEGGNQGHLPSNNPLLEVSAIMAELRMAVKCDALVFTQSGFADYILDEMEFDALEKDKSITAIKIDQDGKGHFKKNANEFFEDLKINHSIRSRRRR